MAVTLSASRRVSAEDFARILRVPQYDTLFYFSPVVGVLTIGVRKISFLSLILSKGVMLRHSKYAGKGLLRHAYR
jgi:hypothetical protein